MSHKGRREGTRRHFMLLSTPTLPISAKNLLNNCYFLDFLLVFFNTSPHSEGGIGNTTNHTEDINQHRGFSSRFFFFSRFFLMTDMSGFEASKVFLTNLLILLNSILKQITRQVGIAAATLTNLKLDKLGR